MTLMEKFERHRSLKDLTTFGIGGPADFFIEVKTIEAMQEVFLFCKQRQLPYFILGKGSNVLFDDRGFAGVVIANRISFLDRPEKDVWHAGGGYSFSLLGTKTAREGWTGLEFASGIPGSVGGAVYMNAGANGSETCQTLVSVDFVNASGEFTSFSKEELSFAYRFSPFQEKQGAIVGAKFRLSFSANAKEQQLNMLRYRKKTQPYHAKSAGCVFRNPPSTSAGALIDRSGLKGKTIGGAQVSTLHANFILNHNNATSMDVLHLIEYIRGEVKQQIGFELEHEVQYVPYQKH